MDKIAAAVIAVVLALVAILHPTAEPEVKSYKNCTALRADYPDGVRSDHPAYSKKLDRDGDGRACER